MEIRPETIHDHPAVARVNLRAFGGMGEPMLVALLRQRQSYDPDLSLVAEQDGNIVGHALFTRCTIRLMGEDVPAAYLAPIGVDPACQRQGVGTALMQEGHRIAAAKGCHVCFLLGHTSYYPRFGYHTGAFGAAEMNVAVSALAAPEAPLEARPPEEHDLSTLCAFCRSEHADVDFSLHPENTLFDWLSPDPRVYARVYVRDGAPVGYARYRRSAKTRVICFLAADAAAAQAMAVQLAEHAPEITLPMHPRSKSAPVFGVQGATLDAWDAGMACALQPGALDAYFAGLSAGRVPGAVVWPPVFDPL